MCAYFREKQSVLGLNQQDEKLSSKWSNSACVVLLGTVVIFYL